LAHPLNVTFFMRGNHQIIATLVKTIKMIRNTTTGAYDGYQLEWHEGGQPSLFTLSIPDIVGVVATEDKSYDL
jgi:hypothetical protein